MWKDINDFEGLYQISDDGQVKSLTRPIEDRVGHRYTLSGRILKLNVIKNGYLVVYLSRDGVVYPKYVHALVAEAYIPNPDGLPVVNHKNGNKKDCSVDNLEWATYSSNNQHAYDTGLKPKGSDFYNARLTEQDVKEIRQLGKYTTYEEIASKYNVNKATVRDVLLNRTWRNVI